MHAQGLAVLCTPEAHEPTTGGEQKPPIGAERHGVNLGFVLKGLPFKLAAGSIPQASLHFASASRRQSLAVRAEGDGADSRGMSQGLTAWRPSGAIPEAAFALARVSGCGCDCDGFAVRTEGYRKDDVVPML